MYMVLSHALINIMSYTFQTQLNFINFENKIFFHCMYEKADPWMLSYYKASHPVFYFTMSM